jgi:hypothetical protein
MSAVAHRGTIFYVALALFSLMFFLLVYAISRYVYNVDFTSLYAAINALFLGENPYGALYAEHLPVVKRIPTNLNPPFTLLLFIPFHFLPYFTGLMLYFFLAIVMGLWAAAICGRYFLDASFWRSHRIVLLLLYSSMFSTFIGFSIAQLGAPLFLLLMLGYVYYCKKKEVAASLCFATAIAMKLFPAVLFFFFLQQKRYRLCLLSGGWLMLFMTLPLIVFRQDIYDLYLTMMRLVMWYGDNWNGSFFAIMMRYFIDTNNTHSDLWLYQLLWFFISACVLLAYTYSRTLAQKPQRSFAMALVLMIFLSPFGWLYYFSLLMPALALCFCDAEKKGLAAMLLWFMAFALINFPISYVNEAVMGSIWLKLSFYSLHSYGVILLLILLLRSPLKHSSSPPHYQAELLYWPVFSSQLFGVLVLIHLIIMHLTA